MLERATKRKSGRRHGKRRSTSGLLQCAASDRGPRQGNEDAYAYVTPEAPDYDPRIGGSIYVLADGMGGHGGGEVASRIVVAETIRAYANTPQSDSPAKRLRQAILQANARVLSEASNGVGKSDMGSTIVACVVRNGHMVIAHVGDSRAYLLRNGTFQQQTTDHLYVKDVLGLSLEEARHHPMKHILSRAMGREGTEPDIKELTSQPGDRLLLCSDGVSNVVSPEKLKEALKLPKPKEAVKSIMAAASRRAEDNITALAVFVRKKKRGIKSDPMLLGLVGGFLALLVLVAILAGGQSPDATGDATGNPSKIPFENKTNGDINLRKAFATSPRPLNANQTLEDVPVGTNPWYAEWEANKFMRIARLEVTGKKNVVTEQSRKDAEYSCILF